MLKRLILIQMLISVSLYALDSTSQKPNIAILDFTGDQTITKEQLSFITGKVASELVTSDAFIVLDRGKMDFILDEQGFQQSGICNSQQCHVQIGQLLGVDNMVSGSIVKFGNKYAMHIEYLDVGTGQIKKTVDLQEKGELGDVFESLCSSGVSQLISALNKPSESMHDGSGTPMETTVSVSSVQEKEVPADALPHAPVHHLSTKRKVAIALWGCALAGAGAGVYFNSRGNASQDDYKDAVDIEDKTAATSAYNDTQDADLYRNTSYGISIGSLIIGAVLWFLPEGK
ncbi:MAG TPA: CsgG/HfaB family protein [Fibrobacteraceae bacterium]|nr:CsgG/HfaB family protein [Fibrobacteraceae bacterium]